MIEALIELSEEQLRQVNAGLVSYNAGAVPFTQEKPFHRLQYGISEDGEVTAGFSATLYCWGILSVDIVWVAEQHRDKGLGTKLMDALEEEATKLGCTLAHLDTFDFQARTFYEKRGYTLFGTLDDCPPGHQRFFLKKVLTPTSTSHRD
jgi:GNAT superfamily N-acetyltransferase